jgi:hypothetical protein
MVFLVIPSIIIGSKKSGYYKSHPEPLKMAIELVDFPIKDGDPKIMVIVFIPMNHWMTSPVFNGY